MNSVHGYSISSYGAMVADHVRMEAYRAALRKAVKPGSVVMDIGAGTGIWSLLACQFGARHVYAVEPDDAIHAARMFAKANGFLDRITFLQDISTRAELPERADVIVSDLRGTLPLFETHIASIEDARKRHLADGGALIPLRDTVWACPVDAPDAYSRHLAPWGPDIYGLDLSANRQCTLNAFHHDRVKSENFLASPQEVVVLDYRTVTEPNVHATLAWKAERKGMVHGLSLWFSAELADGIGFSTGPGNEGAIYGMGLLLLEEPVELDAGDVIEGEIKANLVNGSYIWQWRTKVRAGSGNGRVKADFQQSTFDASILGMEKMRKRASTYVPRLNEDGEAQRLALSLMDGKYSIEEISRKVTAAFPKEYPSWQEAQGWVGRLSTKYSR